MIFFEIVYNTKKKKLLILKKKKKKKKKKIKIKIHFNSLLE
jgi:hypothetical protein